MTVKDVIGGRCMSRRLCEMGLGLGMTMEVVQNTGGPVIVSVGETRMALGRGVASKIMVE